MIKIPEIRKSPEGFMYVWERHMSKRKEREKAEIMAFQNTITDLWGQERTPRQYEIPSNFEERLNMKKKKRQIGLGSSETRHPYWGHKKGRPTRTSFGTSEAQGVTNPDPTHCSEKRNENWDLQDWWPQKEKESISAKLPLFQSNTQNYSKPLG